MGEPDGWRSTPTARGAKLLALSIGGGAAITLLGASAAHAQDAGSHGGDATATGNHSASDQGQTVLVTPGSDPTVAGVHGTVANGGAAGANSGVNNAVNTDNPSSGPPPSQTVASGNATSAGNQSKSKLDQAATSSATGGGLTLIGQDAHVGSWGGALADTGFNSGDGTVSGNADAWGNRSDSWISQTALVNDGSGSTRLLTQEARVENLGLALAESGQNVGDMITTGNASAGGNQSQTGTTQDGLITGDTIGNATVEQASRTRNRGRALANTGFNQTTGDGSTNDAKVFSNGVLIDEDPAP